MNNIWTAPLAPLIVDGMVSHHRRSPTEHRFDQDVSYALFDPDSPNSLTATHPMWSARRPAPVHFRRSDYGDPDRPGIGLADQARDDLGVVLGWRPEGPVRALTQLRRWGWLFNPLTAFFVWNECTDDPVGLVLEVTNTPWKQRHRYAVPLVRYGGRLRARVVKSLHVSPFLDDNHHYDVEVTADAARIELRIDVERDGAGPVLHTAISGSLHPATRPVLTASLREAPWSTIAVSAAIHWQALRLRLKRVPFVPHPDRIRRTVGTRTSRRVVVALLSRFERERLVLVDGDDHWSFGGDGDVELVAELTVLDQRAYTALTKEGAAGLGRGYFEGWWTSADPVAVLRVLIRNMEPWDRRRNRFTSFVQPVTERLRRRLPADTRERNRADISAHYDLGNDLFELFLDDTLTYSAALFDDGAERSLADASRRKYDRLLEHLGVTADDHIVEIGTGWGGFAIHAASTVGCRVTTTTISREQFALAQRRVVDSGLGDRIELLGTDWRDLVGRYDHLVSIEMIEAVSWRDYDAFFSKLDDLVKPGGRVALQAIAIPDARWERAKNTVDYIRKYVFPNGYLPSVGAVRRSVERATSMRVVTVDDHTPSYAETLRRWRANFDANLDAVRALGFDEQFIRLWEFYFMYCEAGFAERHVELKQIVLATE